MADSPSIEIGLRVIRRARIRAWFLAIGLLPVYPHQCAPAPTLDQRTAARWAMGHGRSKDY